MANPNPNPTTRFKPGQSGNPRGGALPPEVHRIRRMTHAEIAEVGTLILEGDVPALRRVVDSVKSKDPDVTSQYTALQVWFATCALKAIVKGDVFALNAFLDRVVGRVKNEIELTGANGGPVLMATMTLEDVRREYDRLIDEEIQSRGKG